MRSAISPATSRWSGLRSNVEPPAARSAPAQNPLPAPVTTTARTESSASVRSKTAGNSRFIVRSKAFSRSGRLSRIVATPSSTEYRIVSNFRTMSHAPAAGHLDDRAGEVAGKVRGEEEHDRRDLV